MINIDEAHFSKENLENHAQKHIEEFTTEYKLDNISSSDYDDLCDKLTKSKASYVGDLDADVVGFITQTGRKIKFRKIDDSNSYEFAVYTGDPEYGEAITYFVKTYSQIIDNSNPYAYDGDKRNMYGMDLDGQMNGLSAYSDYCSEMSKDDKIKFFQKLCRIMGKFDDRCEK